LDGIYRTLFNVALGYVMVQVEATTLVTRPSTSIQPLMHLHNGGTVT